MSRRIVFKRAKVKVLWYDNPIPQTFEARIKDGSKSIEVDKQILYIPYFRDTKDYSITAIPLEGVRMFTVIPEFDEIVKEEK